MNPPGLKLDLGPVWTPGANPAAAAFAAASKARRGKAADAPFTADVRATKGSPAYRAHMYHTKVPPEGIEPFIEHYTAPGDTVLDPFCGSGMTGVAARRLARRALLIDLSPFATFLAYNHCAPVETAQLRPALEAILERVRPDLEPLYRARCPGCESEATVRYTVWSDVLSCPGCRTPYVLWNAAVRSDGGVLDRYPCPSCGRTIVKRLADWAGSEPVLMSLDCPSGCDGKEVSLTTDRRPLATDYCWSPTDPIPAGLDELSRVRRSGVRTVADLFTPRNLHAVARLWSEAAQVEPASLRARALFAVTAILVRASRLVKYIPARRLVPGPILGTMYLPSFSAEVNPLELFRRRIARHVRAAEYVRPAGGRDDDGALCISTQSATDLAQIADASIDYVFTDPPFGHNIQYSELNFIWESWLGWRTDTRAEAIISRSQKKDAARYGDLMAAAFREAHRVLKAGRWMTLVFHNTRAAVWAEIQRGVEQAGFRVEAVQTLDKAHETFKQVTAEGAVGYDVVMNCRKSEPPRAAPRVPAVPASAKAEEAAVDILCALLRDAPHGPCKERTARYLHARLTGELLRSRAPVTLSYRDMLQLLRLHFHPDGKHWSL